MDVLKSLECIAKAGEGSKGGVVIGHTESGKPIYAKSGSKNHKEFSAQDHHDAAQRHSWHAARKGEEYHQQHNGDGTYSAKHARRKKQLMKQIEEHREHAAKHREKAEKLEGKTSSREPDQRDFDRMDRKGDKDRRSRGWKKSMFDFEELADLVKGGRHADDGEIRTRSNGKKYKKIRDGKWVEVKTGRELNQEAHKHHNTTLVNKHGREFKVSHIGNELLSGNHYLGSDALYAIADKGSRRPTPIKHKKHTIYHGGDRFSVHDENGRHIGSIRPTQVEKKLSELIEIAPDHIKKQAKVKLAKMVKDKANKHIEQSKLIKKFKEKVSVPSSWARLADRSYGHIDSDGNDYHRVGIVSLSNSGDGYFEIDRYRRHDHGGGEDGDDWLDDEEIQADYDMGVRKHKDKLKEFNKMLSRAGFKPNAEFDLGEKGHFSISFRLEKKGARKSLELLEDLAKATPKGVDEDKYKRCKQEVKKKSPNVNEYAVCTASLKKSQEDAMFNNVPDSLIIESQPEVAKGGSGVVDDSRSSRDFLDHSLLSNYSGNPDEQILKSGAGSRGGKVVGHTKSGKPIYESHHDSHSSFTHDDHMDAMKLHMKNANYARSERREKPSASDASFADHHEKMADHHRVAARKMRFGKSMDEAEKSLSALDELNKSYGSEYLKDNHSESFHSDADRQVVEYLTTIEKVSFDSPYHNPDPLKVKEGIPLSDQDQSFLIGVV
jgi:hypothetical protein